MDFQRPLGQKLTKSSPPPQIHRFHPFEVKFLLWVDGPNRDGRFFSKNSKYFRLQNQNTEHFAKSLGFLDPKNFAKPAKLGWYKVSKKNALPKSLEVSPKKFSARSDLKWRRKRRKTSF